MTCKCVALSLVAFVGLESTFYQVNESSGSVEVCAVVSPASECPVAAQFNIYLITLGDTAGISVHSSYIISFCAKCVIVISILFCNTTKLR